MEDRKTGFFDPRLICAILLLIFAAAAALAVSRKSPTFDEPYHATAAWVQMTRHDFRMDPEDGPLFHDWSALAVGPQALSADFSADSWTKIPLDRQQQWTWLLSTLYHTPGNDAAHFILRQRMMMLLVGVGLGVLIALWAGRIAGPTAAIVATALFCFDPNFLAHAPLVKNDVAFSLALLAVAMMVWRAGRRLTWATAPAIGLLCGAALTIKFSGLLVGPIVLILLLARAAIPKPWPAMGIILHRFSQRLSAALGVATAAALISYLAVWAAYDFRFAPIPDSTATLDTRQLVDLAARADIMLQTGNANPTARQIEQSHPAPTVRAVLWLQRHRLLPQAFLNGLLYTYQSALLRNSFLCGQISLIGRWSYFPLAMLFKTPLATLAAAAISLLLSVFVLRHTNSDALWTALCLLIPATIYLASAMNSAVNIGLRHVLPVYAFAYVAIGCIAAIALRRWPRGWVIASILAIGLAVESFSAFPNYIPFFNAAAGGSRGGIRLLGDSNLDWGQDLPLLAQWQRQNSSETLYLSYFGLADPASYGIHYVNIPGGYRYGPAVQWPTKPGVIAISATNLQGIWMPRKLYELFYAQFWKFKPKEILGGSIYLYDFPPD